MRLFSCVAVALLSSSVASAATWNPTDDFSVTNGNPNGVWGYGYLSAGAYTPFGANWTDSGNPSMGWQSDAAGNNTWINHRGFTNYGVPDGMLSLHPGFGGEATLLRWNVPAGIAGNASVVGEFLAGDTGVMSVAVLKNGDLANPVWSAQNAGSFNLTIPVAPGDSIDFAVYGSYAFGNTPLAATISAVPEPAAVALLLAAPAMFLRRRRQA